jgi:uncharacterized caspase-like protein
MGKILPPIAVRFLSVLILTFWAGTALADKRVALIVGNGQYTRISPKLVSPANDAHDLAQALAGMGFDVILRTDVGKGEFDQALAEFARKASGADAALFYYAGYGLQHHGENFFLPIDIEVQDIPDLEFQAVGFDSVQQAIDRSAGVKIVILDASRDNSLARQLIASRSWGGDMRGLARIDRTEGFIIAYATAPDQVAQDGAGRNSPFTQALIRRIKEPGLEINTMFRRVTSDVYEMTNGRQRPEVTASLPTDYFLIPVESDSIAWSRIRDSDAAADFKEFIQKFPSSPHAREAQARIDLFGRIREEEARLKREREALEAGAKVAALGEENRRKQVEKQRQAEICSKDFAKLKDFTAALQAAAIQNLAKESVCASIKHAIDTALKDVERGVKRACDADRKTLAVVRNSNIETLKTALNHVTCETVRAEAQQRIAKLEDRRKRKILDTGYSLLKDIGGEEPDYGLYSYAILVNDSDRSAKFLGYVFGDGFNARPPVEETAAQPTQTNIPPVEEIAAQPTQTNILYIPLKRSKAKEWTKGLKVGKNTALRAAYAKHFYDYTMSRALRDHLCVSPAEEIEAACEGDLSRGPYIFAYAKPASKVTPVPPPFLFMDLSDVHERAFPEIIAAFKAQVKREDISDRAKIDTLRLKVLNIVLTTADWLVPVQKAIANIVYSPSGRTEKDKQ